MVCNKWFTVFVDTYLVMPLAMLTYGKGSGIVLCFPTPAFGHACCAVNGASLPRGTRGFVHFVRFVVSLTTLFRVMGTSVCVAK